MTVTVTVDLMWEPASQDFAGWQRTGGVAGLLCMQPESGLLTLAGRQRQRQAGAAWGSMGRVFCTVVPRDLPKYMGGPGVDDQASIQELIPGQPRAPSCDCHKVWCGSGRRPWPWAWPAACCCCCCCYCLGFGLVLVFASRVVSPGCLSVCLSVCLVLSGRVHSMKESAPCCPEVAFRAWVLTLEPGSSGLLPKRPDMIHPGRARPRRTTRT